MLAAKNRVKLLIFFAALCVYYSDDSVIIRKISVSSQAKVRHGRKMAASRSSRGADCFCCCPVVGRINTANHDTWLTPITTTGVSDESYLMDLMAWNRAFCCGVVTNLS
jgi:hypothetical protein